MGVSAACDCTQKEPSFSCERNNVDLRRGESVMFLDSVSDKENWKFRCNVVCRTRAELWRASVSMETLVELVVTRIHVLLSGFTQHASSF